MAKAHAHSWEVTDEFWARVEPLVPKPQRDPNKVYQRSAGAGRPPKPARLVFEAIVYVLRRGCQWKALPSERFGSASAVHQKLIAMFKAPLAQETAQQVMEGRWPGSTGLRRAWGAQTRSAASAPALHGSADPETLGRRRRSAGTPEMPAGSVPVRSRYRRPAGSRPWPRTATHHVDQAIQLQGSGLPVRHQLLDLGSDQMLHGR